MFQNIRVGTPLYVLHKQEPKLEIGEVMSVSVPQPQFGAYQVGMKMVVDVNIKVGEQPIEFQKLPADLSITDYAGNTMVVAEDRNAILNEISILRKNSEKVLESVDYHKGVLDKCTEMIETLNPAAKQEAEKQKEIDTLKTDVADMKSMLARLLEHHEAPSKAKEK